VGDLTMTSGMLTLNSAATISVPTLTMQGGTLNGTAPISLTASAMTWSGGTIGGSGTLSIPSTTTITVGGVLFFDTRPISNAGTINLTSSNYFYMQNNATLTNSGTIDVQADGGMYMNGAVGMTSITNNGTIKKSGGTGNSTLNVPLIAQAGSLFLVQSGTFYIGAVTSSGATFTISTSATLYFYYNDTRTFDAASTISGAGIVQWGSGTNTITGTISAPTVMSGGTLTINSTAAQSIPTLTMQSGTLNGSAAINLTGAAMTWSGGTIGGTGTLSIPATTTITIGGVVYFDTRPISNAGTINIASSNYFYMQNNAALTNSGTIDFQGDGATYMNGTVGTTNITTNGTIKKSTGAGNSTLNVPLIAQSGSQFLAQSGTFYVGAVTSTGATFSVSTGATLYFYYNDTRTFDAASTISGAGIVQWGSGTNTITGTLSAPTVMSGGTLTINSAAAQSVPTLTMQSGTLNGSAAINLTGAAMTWSGGTIGGTGTLSIPAATTITIGGVVYFDTRPISNSGTINIASSNYFYMQNNAALTNSGTIDFQGDGATYMNGAVGTTNITNNGTIKKSAGTGNSTLNVPLIAQSGSQFLAQSGTFYVGAVTSTGAMFSVSTGATLYFYYNDTRTFDAPSTISGAGIVQWGSGTNTITGTLSAATVMSGATLTINSAAAQSVPTLTMQSGTLNGSAAINLTGAAMTWSGGTIGGTGTLSIPATTTITIGGVVYFDTRPISNSGTINIASSNYFYMQNNAALTNSGTIDFQGDGATYMNGTVGTTNITNNGTIKKSAGTGSSTFNVPLIAQSGSQFLAQSGTFYVGAVTSTGAIFTVSTGATLYFYYNDTRTFDAGSTISGAGIVQWGSGANTITGTLSAVTVMSGGTLTINSAAAQSIPTLTMQSGTLGGSAPINLTGAAMTWSGGTIGGTGTLSIPSTTTITISGGPYFDARPISNAGTIAISGYFYMQNNAALTNSGTIDFQGDGGAYLNFGSAAITNNGLLTKSNGTGTSSLTVAVTNAAPGTVRASTGTISFNSLTQSGTLSFLVASATAFGKMNVNGAFVRAGTLMATTTGGYTPPNGTTFQVMTFGSSSGAFATKILNYPAGTFNDSYTATALILTAGSASCVNVPSGVISWFKGEGSANDSVGPNNGTFVGGASTSGGKVGQGFNFNGFSGYVSAPDDISLRPASVTIEGWINFASAPTTLAGIAGKAFGSGFFDSYAVWYDPSGTLRGEISDAGGEMQVLASWTPVPGAWYHVAFTFDSATQAEVLYLNGSQLATATYSGRQIAYDAHALTIGADFQNGAFQFFFPGLVDELTLYSRALSALEIQDIFNADSTGKCYVPPPAPTIGSVAPPNGPIAGGTSVTINGTNLDGVSSATFDRIAATITARTFGTLTVTTPPHAAGSVTVAVTNPGGTASSAGAFTYVSAPTISGFSPPFGPVGSSVTITGSSFTTTNAVRFNGVLAGFTIDNDGQITAIVPTGATSGPITVTNIAGTATSATNFIVGACTPPTITPSGPTTFCAGGSVVLTATAGASYLWSTGATTQSITVTASGSYSVTVTDASGCVGTSAPTSVTVNPIPPATITPSSTSVCAGGSVTLTAPAGAATYLWSTGATTQSIVVSPSSTTTYTVTVTSAAGCTNTGSQTITVTPLAPPTITASGPTTFCTGNSVTLSAPSGMASYSWSTGETTQSIVVSTSGSFTVTVVNVAGCSATSAPVVVTVNPTPTVSISGPNFICGSGPVTLDAGAGFATYTWSTGETTQTITATISFTTVFTVTVTNAAGCSASATHTVTANAQPSAAITTRATVCPGGSSTASVPLTSGATYAWTITGGTISGGAGTNMIAFAPSGTSPVTLDVTVTAGSCSASGSTTVNVSSTLTPTISGPFSICAGGRATLDAGAGHATYSWSTGATTQTISVSPTSTTIYSVTVTDSGGCSGSASHTVTVNQPPAATLNAPASVDANSTGNTATVSAGGTSTYNWTIAGGAITAGQSTPTVTFTAGPTGPITLTVVVATANCSVARSATIAVNALVCSTTPPALQSPADGATGVSSRPTLMWSAVTGAILYDVFINSALVGSTDATSMTVSVPAGRSLWSVVAHLAPQCTPSTLASETHSFTAAESSSCTGNTAPVPKSPSGVTTFSPVTFVWLPAPNATGYRLHWQVGANAPQDFDTTDTSATVIIAESGLVTWSVSALYAGCLPVSSSPLTFTIEKEDCSKHGAANLIGPADKSTLISSSVDFEWSKVEGADGYRLWVIVNGGDQQALGTTVDTTLHKDIDSGVIDWFVETLFDGCPSTFSDRRHFTIQAAATCRGERPAPSSPADRAVVDAALVTFHWAAAADAISYELYLAAANGTPALLGTTSATTLSREVPPGIDLEWFVRANFNGCPAAQSSDSYKLRYQPPQNCPTGRPSLTAPPDDANGVTSPPGLHWTAVPGAKEYRVFLLKGDAGNGAATAPQLIGTSKVNVLDNVAVGGGAWRWYVEPVFEAGCASTRSTESRFVIVVPPTPCTPLPQPRLAAPSQTSAHTTFTLRWSPVPGASSYSLQQSLLPTFVNAISSTTPATEATLTLENQTAIPITYYFRVRAFDNRCTPPEQSPYSIVARVSVLPAVNAEGSTLIGETETVTYTIPIGAEHAGETFTVTPTRPWIAVTPSSGIVGATGTTLTAVVTTTSLPPGTSIGGVALSFGTSSSRHLTTNGGTSSVPISINIVSPVVENPKSGPPPDALIIPAVASADGFNARFSSDVRVTNTSPQVMKYQLTFTPSGAAGISEGRQTTIDIDPGRTIALDEVLRTWFASGSSNTTGTLEIRPLTQSASTTSSGAVKGLANFVTFASSRTYNTTKTGTFGQFIPAVPFANFVGGASGSAKPSILSMQHIAQSPTQRTNLGFVEASGQPVSLLVDVFGDHGERLTSFPVDLNGGQHLQLNGFLSERGIQVNNGRVEVSVASGNGKITAYASVLDNFTSDPLLVSPVTIGNTSSSKYVLPGVAQFSAGAGWQTDTQMFNAGDNPVKATLTFQSMSGGEAKTAEVDLAPHQLVPFDRTLETLFGITNDGGAIGINTDVPTNLITTARTFRPDPTTGGTFGQFIQAVTPDQSVRLGSRPLQLLQVEESERYHSNIGLAEVVGKPTTVEVTAIPPDSKISATIQVDLGANQFIQFSSLLASMGLADTHNARVTVKVIGGEGSVTGYAAVIDAKTLDSTYIPGL
jgi:hypothetical protein